MSIISLVKIRPVSEAIFMTEPDRYVTRPLIKAKTVDYRAYQVNLAEIAAKKSTMIVLSTGLGKTVIAALVAAKRLELYNDSKVLILAPSRPLVDQQARYMRRVLDLDEDTILCLTGQDSPETRKSSWQDGKVIVMTPQALQNDLIQRSYDLSDVSLIVYDEAHRGVGNYAYTFIAELYERHGKNQLSLGLTASPGHQAEQVKTVCENLSLVHVEVRNEKSKDVRDYIVSVDSEVHYIRLPSEIEVLRDILYSLIEEYKAPVGNHGFNLPESRRMTRKEILRVQSAVRKEIGSYTSPPRGLYLVIRNLTALLRIVHLIEFIGTQGLAPTQRYIRGMYEEIRNKKSSKGVKDLVTKAEFVQFENLLQALISKNHRHPKADSILEIVSEQLSVNLDSRILIFTRFRDTAIEVTETLEQLDDVRVSRFVGQSSRGLDKGFTQKKQVEVLDGFRNNEFNVLVATQVGEEGLDIPECNLVIFYDCVPSVVPYIQRRGRTGRRSPGRVVIFVAKGTHDEFYHWSVMSKLKKMPRALEDAEKEEEEQKQTSLEEFADDEVNDESEVPFSSIAPRKEEPENIKLIVDSRELPTAVARELARLNIEISGESLEIGDYVASEDVAVERKESADFIQSLIDGRLFVQLTALRSAYRRPVLIIEGEQITGLRAVNPASIYGALASIAIRIQVPIIWTRNAEETANVLYRIAHLEQVTSKKPLRTRSGETKGSDAEAQEYILSGFPGVDTVTSRALLTAFGSLERIFSEDVKSLQKVKGVGPKIASRILRLLQVEYPEYKKKPE
ncbi:MAG: DEAD/DEAH box helicase family protein [Candidatus Thorarchaeota archaeon]|nr:DEAD/DEAH box helicase family protein [Candidatus Thorarchaeota archaeon]